MPRALGEDGEEAPEERGGHVNFVSERKRHGDRRERQGVKTKEWVLNKKNRRRLQGKDTYEDSKYTGRKRNNTKW